MLSRTIPSLIVLSTLSCAGGAMGRARTIPKGQWQGYVAYGTAASRNVVSDTLDRERVEWELTPWIEGGVRRGVTDNLELRLKATPNGVGFHTKIQLRRSPAEAGDFDLALDPGVGAFYPKMLQTDLPLLLGINVGGGSQFVFGPRIGAQTTWLHPNEVRGFAMYAGASLGFAWKLNSTFTVMPEVTYTRRVIELSNVYGASRFTRSDGGEFVMQAGVGFLIGGNE